MSDLHHGAAGLFEALSVTVMLAFAALIYLRGWISLRSNYLGRIPTWRACSFLTGLALTWVASASPFSSLDHELLTVHMLKHLLLMTLAPPLIWLGDPARVWSQLPRYLRTIGLPLYK